MSFQRKVIEIRKNLLNGSYLSPTFSEPNEKLKKDNIFSFGLPAGLTCPGAGACNNGFCYAQTGRYKLDVNITKRVRNLEASKKDSFVDLMIDKIFNLPKKVNTLRLHDSGDFYSKKYIEKWTSIIKFCDHINFYAYTKSYVFFNLDPLWNLSNMTLIQSIGSKDDSKINYDKPHAKIFLNLESLIDEGYTDCSERDIFAANGVIKVGLIVKEKTKKKFKTA